MNSIQNIEIRKATINDSEEIWPIISQVITKGETYVFYPNSSKAKMINYWLDKSKHTFVAYLNKRIVGTFIIKPNQPDLGSHIANASYMVHPDFEGKGIGRFMCEYSLQKAKELNFLAMQFNMVITENYRAIKLWKSFGFKIIGEIPKAFNHKSLGYSNAFIMYKEL